MQPLTLLTELIEALRYLPGVGQKSAQRMAYYLLEKNRGRGLKLSSILKESMEQIGNCNRCRDYTDIDCCQICSSDKRDESLLCVVESPSDILAIESTASFNGKYFVLMGQLSPLDGIGPDEIGIPMLTNLLREGSINEIIVATSSTIEGEATAHYISQIANKVSQELLHELSSEFSNEHEKPISVSRLAQGVPVGGELE